MAAIIFACEEIWLWIYKESITIPPRNHFGVFKYQNQPETKRRGNSNPPVFVFQSGLIVACYHGYVDVVIALSQCPYVDVNWQDNEGNTALITAAQAGNPPPPPRYFAQSWYMIWLISHIIRLLLWVFYWVSLLTLWLSCATETLINVMPQTNVTYMSPLLHIKHIEKWHT